MANDAYFKHAALILVPLILFGIETGYSEFGINGTEETEGADGPVDEVQSISLLC